MRVETWLLLVVSSLAICTWLVLLSRLWILRNVFEIAARAPNFVIVQQIASVILAISVLIHWTLLWEGQRGLNCNIISAISYSCKWLSVIDYYTVLASYTALTRISGSFLLGRSGLCEAIWWEKSERCLLAKRDTMVRDALILPADQI